jgi:hypothetical protein
MDDVYRIIFYDKRYDATIENFLGCSCVDFVAVLEASLGGHGAYMQFKHVYHVLQTIVFCGLMEDFIHHCMWSWDEL